MTSDVQRRPARRHGYLLLEVLVAGALLATVVLAVYTYIAQGRIATTKAAYRDTATSLAHKKLAELACCTPLAVNTQAQTAVPGAPGYTWGWTVAAANLAAQSTPNLLADLWELEVTVRYDAPLGSADDVADGTADGTAEVVLTRLAE
jgi:Tfp pilus assembly protein PilV